VHPFPEIPRQAAGWWGVERWLSWLSPASRTYVHLPQESRPHELQFSPALPRPTQTIEPNGTSISRTQ
jgi:hypothetical protein